MNINFKQPKYILPLILLPFFCLFFFVYQSSFAKKKIGHKQKEGFNGTVADVSPDIKKKQLDDKLDAYRNSYKEGDGMTAVTALPSERTSNPSYDNAYTDNEKRTLDSISLAMKQKYSQRDQFQKPHNSRQAVYTGVSRQDKEMANTLNSLSLSQHKSTNTAAVRDPMETFKLQMAYLDSMNKANDPATKAEKQKKEAQAKAATFQATEAILPVHNWSVAGTDFNTVMPGNDPDLIKVVIDENLTGYVGSRIRLRLLGDIRVGSYTIPKDSYLYALITGFSGQRVTLSVRSILYQAKILPVKLEVYDLDGLAGLYVPESAFRDFTKDLGTNTVQGVTIDNSGTGSATSQFMMSTVDKLFESTSSAIAGIIRKNKAKIKYNSYLYLIDDEAHQNALNNH